MGRLLPVASLSPEPVFWCHTMNTPWCLFFYEVLIFFIFDISHLPSNIRNIGGLCRLSPRRTAPRWAPTWTEPSSPGTRRTCHVATPASTTSCLAWRSRRPSTSSPPSQSATASRRPRRRTSWGKQFLIIFFFRQSTMRENWNSLSIFWVLCVIPDLLYVIVRSFF